MGFLKCPNRDCKMNVGAYNFFGGQCSCDKFDMPAFLMIKEKLYSEYVKNPVNKEEPEASIGGKKFNIKWKFPKDRIDDFKK